MSLTSRQLAQYAANRNRRRDNNSSSGENIDNQGRSTNRGPKVNVSEPFDLPFGLGRMRWTPQTYSEGKGNSNSWYARLDFRPFQSVIGGTATPNPNKIPKTTPKRKVTPPPGGEGLKRNRNPGENSRKKPVTGNTRRGGRGKE